MFYAQQNLIVRNAGLVPEPARQVPQEGEHKEGAGTAGPQRAPADLQRGADPPRGDREAGAATQREEADATGDTSSQPHKLYFYGNCNLGVAVLTYFSMNLN